MAFTFQIKVKELHGNKNEMRVFIEFIFTYANPE